MAKIRINLTEICVIIVALTVKKGIVRAKNREYNANERERKGDAVHVHNTNWKYRNRCHFTRGSFARDSIQRRFAFNSSVRY